MSLGSFILVGSFFVRTARYSAHGRPCLSAYPDNHKKNEKG